MGRGSGTEGKSAERGACRVSIPFDFGQGRLCTRNPLSQNARLKNDAERRRFPVLAQSTGTSDFRLNRPKHACNSMDTIHGKRGVPDRARWRESPISAVLPALSGDFGGLGHRMPTPGGDGWHSVWHSVDEGGSGPASSGYKAMSCEGLWLRRRPRGPGSADSSHLDHLGGAQGGRVGRDGRMGPMGSIRPVGPVRRVRPVGRRGDPARAALGERSQGRTALDSRAVAGYGWVAQRQRVETAQWTS